MRFFQPKRAELDPEELEMLQPARCRPERLEAIRRATGFSRKEIQFVYRAFKQECPTGMVTEDTFKSIYAKFFPQGDSSQYAHFVFKALDRNKTGTITFSDIMLGLSLLLKGSLQERIRWAFSLYDVNDDGYVTKEELAEVVTAIYDLMGNKHRAHHRSSGSIEGDPPPMETPHDHVDRMFKKLDLNHDGVITEDEFIDYCSTDLVAKQNPSVDLPRPWIYGKGKAYYICPPVLLKGESETSPFSMHGAGTITARRPKQWSGEIKTGYHTRFPAGWIQQ